MPIRILRRERFWRQLHFYLGLLLSLQLLAWFASGVVMSWYPIAQVRGEHLVQPAPPADWSQAQITPAQALLHAPAAELSLSQRGTEPVYQLQSAGQSLFISAVSGLPLASLPETQIRQLAQSRYQANQTIQQVQLLDQLPAEARGLRAPLWHIRFNDPSATVFYLHPVTGQLLRVRTDTWRLFDFFWMLHIMDYQDRSNFNHPLLIISAGSALFFTLGGLMLLGFRLKRASRPSSGAG